MPMYIQKSVNVPNSACQRPLAILISHIVLGGRGNGGGDPIRSRRKFELMLTYYLLTYSLTHSINYLLTYVLTYLLFRLLTFLSRTYLSIMFIGFIPYAWRSAEAAVAHR